MGIQNWENRTLFHGDNLRIMRGMNSGTVDLVATDPPFKKGRDFHATPDSLAAGAKFEDRWNWDEDVHPEWVDAIKDDWPAVHTVVEMARVVYGQDMAAYLCWLGVRLMEMHRLLKPTGSIYLHIDHTAHAYVKCLMDAIFGKENFRNEIVWCYPPKGNGPRLGFHRKHDTILYYGKSNESVFVRQYTDLDDRQKAKFSFIADDGRRYKDFKGVRTYLDEIEGRPVPDWWVDIAVATQSRIETTGYPTQKPLALLERIIKASSNKGDTVLDPFAGCATTPIAAERLGRQWVGVDIWDGAYKVVRNRLQQEGLAVPNTEKLEGQQRLTLADITYATQPPERTDDNEVSIPFLRLKLQRPVERWQRLTHKEVVELLAKAQGSVVVGKITCAGCGRSLEPEFMELDHILPRKDGGANDITNRVLLCRPCNGFKGANYTLSGLVRENKKRNWMESEIDAKSAHDAARLEGLDVRDKYAS